MDWQKGRSSDNVEEGSGGGGGGFIPGGGRGLGIGGLILLGVVMVEIIPLLPRRAGERTDDLPPIGTVPLD